MKIFIFKFTSIFIFSFISFGIFSQNRINTFDQKKHADTVISKKQLNALRIQGVNNPQNSGKKINIAPKINTNINKRFRKSDVKIIASSETGLPLFIASSANNATARLGNNEDVKTSCLNYLENLSTYLQIKSPSKNFIIDQITEDINGKKHIRLSQEHKGIKIHDSHVLVHLTKNNVGEVFNGRYQIVKNFSDTIPAISAELALKTVYNDLQTKTKIRTLNAQEMSLLEYSGPKIDTLIFTLHSPFRQHVLAYHISIRPNLREHYEYFIDAKSNKILQSTQNTCGVDGPRSSFAKDLNGVNRQINTYQEGANYILLNASESMFQRTTQEGIIQTLDANKTYGSNFKVRDIISSTNQWTNPNAVSAHSNAKIAYEYFKNSHGRKSINGKDGSVISVINVVDEDGLEMDNAYWNGKAMFYGNGNSAFKPLAGAIDVGGHEMTHGVVQNTANLDYQGESGAINESMADIFGFMMDSTDWTIGEDVTIKNSFPSGSLRSLQDPHNGGKNLNDRGYQPKHVNEQYRGSQDNGGVHINSGIPNHAFFLLASTIGKAKAAAIFYHALETYLTQNAKFIDLRIAITQSAKDLYPTDANLNGQIAVAFDGVGIIEKPIGTDSTPKLPINPGQEYLLVYNTELQDPYGLYRSDLTTHNPLTEKIISSKPSVRDDGTLCYFVGTDKRIYYTNVSPNAIDKNLYNFDNNAFWSNVAISKDGKRLAAVSVDKDTSIYVYDFGLKQWARFILYNPTFSDVRSSGVVYADAIEWDYSGKRLVYDAFNRISNINGDNIEYWDINFIDVFDTDSNKFAQGQVFKIITDLAVGESIGNPTFSKTSPEILAFDYVDDIELSNFIIGYNVELNDLNLIARNNSLGFPSFNKEDKKVAFAKLNANGILGINTVNLNGDKISSNLVEQEIFFDAKWPVYFAVGNRDVSTAVDFVTSENLMLLYPNPAKDVLHININENNYYDHIEIYNSNGLSVLKNDLSKNIPLNPIAIDIAALPQGVYLIKLLQNKNSIQKVFVKN